MEKKHPFKIQFQSENIDFVRVSFDLIPQYLELFNNPNVNKGSYLYSKTYTYESVHKWVNKKISTYAETFSMIERKSGNFIGIVEFYVNGIPNSRKLGISILEEYQGKKYGTEAIVKMIDYGFQKLHLENINLTVFSNNSRAIHCYKKLGFVEYKIDKNIDVIDNEPVDDIYMKLINPEIDLKDKNSDPCKIDEDLGIKSRNTCYDVNKGEIVMKFTDNFSVETKSKAEFLEQMDLHEEKERLIKELIEQMGPHLLREGDKYRKEGMSEADVEIAIQKKETEILNNYNGSVESLQKGIETLRMLNELYAKKDEIMENRGR